MNRSSPRTVALACASVLGLVLLCAATWRSANPMHIYNVGATNTQTLKVQSYNANTNLIECINNSNIVAGFSKLGALVTTVPLNSRTNLGIQAGQCVTSGDDTVTNTFGKAFSVAPVVITSQIGPDTTSSNICSVTTTGFVLNTGKPGVTNVWIAIGAP